MPYPGHRGAAGKGTGGSLFRFASESWLSPTGRASGCGARPVLFATSMEVIADEVCKKQNHSRVSSRGCHTGE